LIKSLISKGLILLLTIFSQTLLAQTNNIQGKVVEIVNGEKVGMPLANVYWLDGSLGTITNNSGAFEIALSEGQHMLVASFVGYKSDTVHVGDNTAIEFVLSSDAQLKEVTLIQREKATKVNLFGAVKVETIDERELLKAACCNLSESFETNPSVDVSISDAVTGTKQIQMLGLAGPYAQITRENIPDVRGLSAVSGLTFTPGHWIESIQLNKGAGSVVNGYESITGQINVNLRNPRSMDKMYLNFYANGGGRMEANANFKADIGKKLGTALLVHWNANNQENDVNADGFLDMPIGKTVNVLNRWELYSNLWHVQFGVKGLMVDKTSGQFGKEDSLWKGANESQRLESWAKIGKVNKEKPWQSTGLQLSASVYNHNMKFGDRFHNGIQESFYANLVHQTIIGNTNNTIKLGASYQWDRFDEEIAVANYNYIESVPGVFTEYAYKYGESFDLVIGLRADYHNIFGVFATPRMHARWAINETSVLRFSGGRGARTARVFAENMGSFASNRAIINGNVNFSGFAQNSPETYGVNQEIAWNFGLNFTKKFRLDYRDGVISADLYSTQFIEQVIIDYDANPQQMVYYNLSNVAGAKSFANSLQLQLDYEVINRLDVRLAYRFLDVRNSYMDNGLLQKPLQSKHRSFINVAYETRTDLKFDATLNWVGAQRLPITSGNPEEFRLEKNSPSYFLLNLQISKFIEKNGFDIYIGVENVLDYRQEQAIVAASDPSSPYFDASMVWAPVFGRTIYAGLRYKLK
jgi:outer membrane receptor for ferrienterochelin and colicins